MGEDPLVGHGERDADHQREGKLEPLDEGRMAEIEDGGEAEAGVVGAGAEGAVGVEQCGAEERAAEDAVGE